MTKYHNKKVTIDNIVFDSIAESRRYGELKLLVAAGEISNISVHPSYQMQPGFMYRGTRIREIRYIADFTYWDNTINDIVIEDVKGVQTEAFKIKWKMALNLFPQYDWRIVKTK